MEVTGDTRASVSYLEPGNTYRILVKGGFDADSWTPVSDEILAAGLRTSWLDPVATAVGGRLYRVELVGP